ncbi:hypothetical protein [Histidinibacterium lentulum]|uniref:Transporter n=1 Tax=Histidinibacterium lentulum TaxID=2480588 RepID=A0A3N2R869_9RHOB|nr:hypothetical protein [Histidinibacterium lentulum]ROU03613.1 hypothetical protein EAT49_04770 [Histidinibacterium lentulum]
MLRLCLMILLTCAGDAAAGPWMRGEGEVFLSFGTNVALSDTAQRPVHWDPTVYLEYGLTPRLTLGADLYIANGDEEETGSVFLRFPLHAAETGLPVSASLAYGLRHDRLADETERIARAGLHVGRPLPQGWLSADAAAIFVLGGDRTEGKLDLTWGRSISERWTGVLQMQTGIGTAGDFYAKAAPSALIRVTDRTRIEIGVVHALTGDRGTGLRIATWWDF